MLKENSLITTSDSLWRINLKIGYYIATNEMIKKKQYIWRIADTGQIQIRTHKSAYVYTDNDWCPTEKDLDSLNNEEFVVLINAPYPIEF